MPSIKEGRFVRDPPSGDDSRPDDVNRPDATNGAPVNGATNGTDLSEFGFVFDPRFNLKLGCVPSTDIPDPMTADVDTPIPDQTFAVRPYFPHGEIVELVGAHGIYKSSIALHACLSVASGISWGGITVNQGRAIFVTMEDQANTIRRRVRSWIKSLSESDQEIAREALSSGRFRYLPRESADNAIVTRAIRVGTEIDKPHIARLIEICQGSSLVVLETAARIHAGAEDNDSLRVFATAVEEIARQTGACVVIVRHTGKADARQKVIDSYVGRGGGSFADAVRSLLVITRAPGYDDAPTPDVIMSHMKSLHLAPSRKWAVQWRPERISDTEYYMARVSDDERTDKVREMILAMIQSADDGVIRSDVMKPKDPEFAKIPRAVRERTLDGMVKREELTETNERIGSKLAKRYRLNPEYSPSGIDSFFE